MIRSAFAPALLTGAFCSAFTVFVAFVAPMLDMVTVIGISFVSGFLGSLFATFVMGRTR